MKNTKARKKARTRTERAHRKKDRLRPVSLYPLEFESAIAGFMGISAPKRKPKP
jgi:hypothetical protein